MFWFRQYCQKFCEKDGVFLFKLLHHTTLAFKKNAKFYAENLQKWQKIVIITSTPAGRRSVRSAFARKSIECCFLKKASIRRIKIHACLALSDWPGPSLQIMSERQG
jgi:hypothetical protein